MVNGIRLTPGILTRGLVASLGLDYFNSITPTDPYRVGRYDESHEPNSILFGIGGAGGLLNQSSKVATFAGDRVDVRYSFGSWDRQRVELDANRVLRRDTLALSLAAVHQENGGWRAFDFQDKKRVFASVKFRPARQLSFTVMGETGRNVGAIIRSTVDSEEALAWYDNRTFGGDIYAAAGPTTLTRVLVADNTGHADGGGVLVATDGDVKILSSTFVGNGAVRGGGVLNAFGKLTIRNSTISDNEH